MSSSVPSRSLSLTPFIAADGVLLLTALLIAWRTSGELTGGALFGLVFCVGLGAVMTVLPFVIQDVRERDAALAARQRELVDLVNSSTATTSRWGSQWTAAATGLEDAAGLASRSIAAAGHLPVVFQEKIDALAECLAQAENAARAREDRATKQEDALVARAAQAAQVALSLERMLADFNRVEAGLREQQVALATTLGEIPAAVAQVRAVREAVDEQLASAPGQIEAHVTRFTTEADERLAATTNALGVRLADLENALASLTAHLERVKTLDIPVPASQSPASASETVPLIAPREKTVISVCEKTVAEPVDAPRTVALRVETIMDPFYIPRDGYSALADAMDNDRS
jgi:hypothetical protein